MSDFDGNTLLTFAEIAIALAGFSAIVVLFKRRETGTWLPEHADRFIGMVVHAMAAAFFCVLPVVVAAFASGTVTWSICSASLGVQVIVHVIAVLRLSSTGRLGRVGVVLGGSAVVLVQLLNVFGIGFSREFGPYLVGVLWHLLHAGGLFVALVWVPAESIDPR